MHYGTFPMLTGDPHRLAAAEEQNFELWEMQPGVRRELTLETKKRRLVDVV
jgi:hypothetical protein